MSRNQTTTNTIQRSIDLRTDTSTLPTREMLDAMAHANLGNDGLREDPTVNELEEYAASLLGKDAALFVPSGTMGNLVALLSYTNRGDTFLAEGRAHVITHESGYSDIAQLNVRRLRSNFGIIDPEAIDEAIKNSQEKLPRLLLLENTHNEWGGAVVPSADMKAIYQRSHAHGVPVHLDGARIFNAATYLKEDVRNISGSADSVMFCLSKGLCAPVGSMVAGSEEFIARCRASRKLLGGGMRQAGVLAAAGLYALKFMIPRLSEDHKNAAILAAGLSKFDDFTIDLSSVKTNIVLFGISSSSRLNQSSLTQKLATHGIKVSPRADGLIRCVTHKDISEDDIHYTLEALKKITNSS